MLGAANNPDGFPVVALCTSAGGLDALTRVLAPLPDDLAAAVVVLQHVAPSRTPLLPALLRRRISMPVRSAVDGDVLTRGQVLVVPPGVHMLVGADEHVRLLAAASFSPPRPSADLLLCSLAVALGPRVIGVILTGAGSDGAVGAQAVHAFGGRVLVESPETAFAPGMPLATLAADSPETPLPVDALPTALLAVIGAGDMMRSAPSRRADVG